MKTLCGRTVEKLFTGYLEASGYSQGTIRWKICALRKFTAFLDTDTDFRDIGEKEVKTFLEYLDSCLTERTGRPYSKRIREQMFSVIRQLYRYLYQDGLVIANPLQDMKYRTKGIISQREILTVKEMGQFLDSIGEENFRDRAMFELMYSSGLRCSEVAALTVGDIDFEARMILIRDAKFSKDRIVPVSEIAVTFLKKHLAGRRKNKTQPVFCGSKGAIRKNSINRIFKKHLKEAGLYREGLSSHSIRHSVAVHLIAGGLDLRFVQELLDHESIETTCTYTNDLVENIKRIYKTYAPRENEYYREIDENYLERLESFRQELIEQNRLNDKQRKAKRKYYFEKKKRSLTAKH